MPFIKLFEAKTNQQRKHKTLKNCNRNLQSTDFHKTIKNYIIGSKTSRISYSNIFQFKTIIYKHHIL